MTDSEKERQTDRGGKKSETDKKTESNRGSETDRDSESERETDRPQREREISCSHRQHFLSSLVG